MANKLTKILAGVLIAVAVLLGLFAIFLGHRSGQDQPPPDQTQAKAIYPIVVASTALVPGQPITADQLKIAQVAVVPPGAFTDPASAVGRVPANPIPAQSPIVEGGLTSGLADQLQPGERAVAVKVDDISAVGNRIRPGNYVDVFLQLQRQNNGGPAPLPGAGGLALGDIPVTQARLLLSRVRVLQFGDATPDRDAGSNGNTNNNVNPQTIHTAILAVPTEDVDTLTVGAANGSLSLALRSPRDDDAASAPVAVAASSPEFADPSARAAAGVALAVLSDNVAGKTAGRIAPVRAAPSHASYHAPRYTPGGSLEVIRGGRTDTVTY